MDRWRGSSWLAAVAGFLCALLIGLPAATPRPLAVADCTVDARLSEAEGLQLAVTYRCRSSVPLSFDAGDARTKPHLRDLAVRQGDGFSEAAYRVDIGALARSAASTSFAVGRDNGVLAVLGAWLLEPQGFDRIPVIDLRVTTAPGLSFSSGLPRVGDAWQLASSPVGMAGYTALGRFAYREIPVPAPGSLRPGAPPADSVLRVALLPGVTTGDEAVVFDWVARTAMAEAHYWQGFTAEHVLLGLVPRDGTRGLGYGRAQSGGGATIIERA